MAKAGRIDSIEVENFKSYRGKQLIGPFQQNFTAVIGPNGAGKSNLMDAISFVLGVTTSDLRGKQLKDLVFRFDGGPPPGTKCYVKLNFVDKENQKITFMRSINSDNTCTYSLGEKSVTWATYLKKLHEINIFPRLKNFLVFQGDVANVAQKSPKEITAIIEAISGSADLREEYEKLQLKEKTARESTMFQYQKKRGITAEKRQFKEQTKEAEKFNQLTDKIDHLTVKQNLLQLFYIQQEITEFETKRKQKIIKLQEIEKNQIELLDKLAKIKQEQAKAYQTSLKQQKKIRENEKLLDKKRPSAIKNREEVAFLERRIRDQEAEIKRFTQMYSDQQKKIQQLDTDLKEIDLQEAEFEKTMKEKETTAVTLTPEQVKQYSNLKEEVGKKVAKELNEVQQLDRQHKLDSSTLEGFKNQKRDLLRRQEEVTKEIEQLKPRAEKIQAIITEVVQNKTAVQTELDEILNGNNEAKRKQQEISEKLKEIHTALQEAKHDIEKQSEQQKRYEQAVDSMKRLYPGVFGRILDLSQPKNTKHNLAITVALGKHMDSIVVEDEKVGFQCIEYLKEQRVGTATFIPLDAIKTRPIEESLRSLGKRVHPIIDVIRYDPHFQKAFEYVCGSTLVVESLEEARKLAFGDERYKVVTVDGSLISKSGMMTGGTGLSGKLQQKAKRWDLKEVNKLKKDRDEYLKQLTELGHQLRSFAKEQQLSQEVLQLETRLKSVKYELELAQDKLKKNQNEGTLIGTKLKQLQTEKNKLKQVVAKRAQKMDDLRATVNAAEDEIFAAFSGQLGIENVREYESARINRSKEESEFRIRLSSQRARILNLLEYEKGRDLAKSLKEQKDKLKAETEALQAAQNTIAKTKAALDKEKEEHEGLVRANEGERQAIVAKERDVKELKRQLEDIRKAAVAQFHQSSALENQQEQLRNKRHAVYRACARGEIDLPILSGVEELPGPVDPDHLSEKLLKEDAVELDYSTISKKYRTLTKAALDEKLHQLADKINGLGFEREAIAPNHKATEKLGDVEKKLEQANADFEEAKKAARLQVEEFKAIREKRCRLFMQAFDHISKNIDLVYKELTGGAGAAYLTLDNLEEPYLHGTSFNPMPPHKLFGDITNLSGGEKSVAALALLFAVASYKPAPFFVLDEVDAALDPKNVNLVANYMKTHAEAGTMQFITISLKDKCFDKASALVGVYVDADLDSSKTLTLDLTAYPTVEAH